MDRHQNISAEDLGLSQEQYLEILNCPDVYQQVVEQLFLQTKGDEENKYDEEEKIDAREFERNEYAKRSDEYYYAHKINDKNFQDHPLKESNLLLPQRLNNLRRKVRIGADPILQEAFRRQDKARGLLLEERPKKEHKRHKEPKETQVQEKKSQQKAPQKEKKVPGRNLQLRRKRPVRFHRAMQDEVENEQESIEIEVEEVPKTVVPQKKSEKRKVRQTVLPQEKSENISKITEEKPDNLSKIPELTEYMTKKPEQDEKPAKIPEHRFDISHPKMASHQRHQHRQRQIEDRSGSKCNIF